MSQPSQSPIRSVHAWLSHLEQLAREAREGLEQLMPELIAAAPDAGQAAADFGLGPDLDRARQIADDLAHDAGGAGRVIATGAATAAEIASKF